MTIGEQEDSMTTCRMPAIALITWYLIAPPVHWSSTEPAYLDTHAEFRKWNILHAFDSVDDCDAGNERAKSDAANGTLTSFDGGSISVIAGDPQPLLDQQAEAECMSADDPRIDDIKAR